MNMQTSSTVILSQRSADSGTSLPGNLLRLNAAVWVAGLVVSLAVSIPAALRYERSTTLTVRDGRLAMDFEHFITREHPYRRPSLNAWTAAELALFQSGKPGLVVGTGGWLFSTEEFPLPSQRQRHLQANIAHIHEVVKELEQHGIRTVILPIPAKAELYAEEVPEALRPHVLDMKAVADALQARNLEWIPLAPAFTDAKGRGKQVFFRTETHWTPEGARLAATTASAWIQGHVHDEWPRRQFDAVPGKRQTLVSDLENYLPLAPHFSKLLPPVESFTPYEFSSSSVTNDEGALFSDTGNPVAIVGTSYSADNRWSFPGWMRVDLGTDIDNISEKGRGPFVPMDRFRKLVASGKTGARLVIWEMPVRTLAMDLTPQPRSGH